MNEAALPSSRIVGLIAHQFSGTHLLGSCLDSHPDVSYLDEIYKYISPTDLKKATTAKEISETFDSLLSSTKESVLVLDVKYNFITPAVEAFLRQRRCIHLTRKDLVKHYYAKKHAEYRDEHKIGEYQPGKNRYDVKEPPKAPKIDFNYKEFKKFANTIHDRRLRFAGLGGLILTYEEVTNDGESITRLPRVVEKRLIKFLEVDRHPLTTKLVKMSPTSLEGFMADVKLAYGWPKE